MSSSQTFEFISCVRCGDKVVKKRTVEKTDFDPACSPIIFPDDDVLPSPGSQEDPSEPVIKTIKDPSSDAASRSVSVNPVSPCHVISRSYPSQAKVEEWIPHRPEFLYELLRLECLVPQNMACSKCQSPAEYCCLSCVSKEVVCKACLLSRHSTTPLHNVQVCSLRFITEL